MSLNEIVSKSRFIRFEGDAEEVTKGFARINVKNLFPDSGLFFDVYFPVVGSGGKALMHKLLGKGQFYDPKTRQMLTDKGFTYFYVRHEDMKAFEGYLQNNTKSRLSAQNVTVAEKTELLYRNAEYIVEKAFSDGQTEEALPQGATFAREAAKQFSQSRMTSGELLKIFSKDYNTFTHSIQVSLLGMAFCLHLGYSEKEAADFGQGALFHDIGKSEIDIGILNKPSRLTAEEFDLIKEHPRQGYESLAKLNLLTQDQLAIVLQHHEDANGKGYPQGLKSPDIHRYAKIVRIIDTYDALTTRRAYKEALSAAEAFHIMENAMKPALDEQILKSFWLFMKIQEHPVDHAEGARLSIEIGSMIHVQLSEKSERVGAKFIGMDAGAYLVVSFNSAADLREQIFKGEEVVVRYMSDGTIFGFEAKVIALVLQPARLIFLTYPERIQSCEIRKHARFDCIYYSRIILAGVPCQGIITNISMGGCQFVTDQLDENKASKVKAEDSVTLSFQPPGGMPVESLPGEVRNVKWSNNRRVEIGIRFLDFQADVRNTLTECIRNLAMAGNSVS